MTGNMKLHRAARLKELLDSYQGDDAERRAIVTKAVGRTKGRITQLLKDGFGERAAESYARSLGLRDPRWFERPIGTPRDALPPSMEPIALSPVKTHPEGKPEGTGSDDLETIGGEPTSGPGSVIIPGDPYQVAAAKGEDVVIRQFDARGSMGDGLVLDGDQPGVIRSWTVSRDWLALNVKRITSTKNLCVVTGFGDSMRPTYNPGDPLLVDIGVTSVEHDGIYFFRVGNHGFIKRLQTIPGQGIRVISDNKDKGYETWTITPDMDLQVFGKVVRLWRGDEF